jgi:Uma2 family endonuclease
MTMTIQNEPTRPARETLPTMYDLPSEEVGDAGMPDEYHAQQATLLKETFRPPAIPAGEVFSAIDMNLYYDDRHENWYKRPDWFGVINVPRFHEGCVSRSSYIYWEEDEAPLIVVELLSPATEKEDLGRRPRDANEAPTKWEVYEHILRVPYYAVFSGKSLELRIFQLGRDRYKEVIGHNGRFWIPEAGLGLGLWQGCYDELERLWLRWFDAQGNCIPTLAEIAEQERREKEQERREKEQERREKEQERREKEAALSREAQSRQQADQERQRAENAEQQAERLAEMLRQLGHDPDKF